MNVSSRLATAGLVALVALDVVLVGMAMRSTTASALDTTPVNSASIDSTGALVRPGSASSATPTVTPSLSPSATPSTTPSATATTTATTVLAAPLQTILVALDTQRAWRVVVGSCAEGGAAVVTTIDGGATWADAKAPLRTIVRVRPTDGQAAFVIGAGADCKGEFHSTTDSGATWAPGSAVSSAWFRDPANPSAVKAPGPSTSQPCGTRAVLDLAVLSAASARVLCADGLVRSTTDTAASWKDSGKAGGAVALAVPADSPAQTYVALLDATGCAGVQVRRVDQSVATSCASAPAPTEPGQIALSLVDGGGWLSVGETTMRSTDKLLTWSSS